MLDSIKGWHLQYHGSKVNKTGSKRYRSVCFHLEGDINIWAKDHRQQKSYTDIVITNSLSLLGVHVFTDDCRHRRHPESNGTEFVTDGVE
jgi:hypothetical protein